MKYPRLIHYENGVYSGYTVADLYLPEWYDKEYARLVFEDDGWKKRVTEEARSSAKAFGTSKIFDEYKVPTLNVNFCECCGLSYVQYSLGDATALGIDGHEWRENSPFNRIREHNIDTLAQLVTLYDVWIFYLNGLEIKKEMWDEKRSSVKTV